MIAVKQKHKNRYDKWNNNKSNNNKRDNGYKLIKLLKQNPEKFRYTYQLVEKYECYGLELSSLTELLHDENERVRFIAIGIYYDLSTSIWDEISDDIMPLLKDENTLIVKYALKITATYPYSQNCLIPFNYLNHDKQEIRLTAMELFDSYSTSTLKYISEYLSNTKELLYQECVSLLLSSAKLNESEINNLINCDNRIKQKFAIIIACKYPEKFAQIIQQDFKDDDINQYILNKRYFL